MNITNERLAEIASHYDRADNEKRDMARELVALRAAAVPRLFPWRTGTKVGRTIYDASNTLIGVMDRAEDAMFVVEAVNSSFCDCGARRHRGNCSGSCDNDE